jgi:hypothetical protein
VPEIDRTRYCEIVGINRSTLSRWVNQGAITPDTAGLHYRQVFTEDDVAFGWQLICVLNAYRGQYALWEAVEIVRGERKVDRFSRSPPGAPDAI